MGNTYWFPPLAVLLVGFVPGGFAALELALYSLMGATGGQPTTTPWFFPFYIGLLLVGVSLMYVGLMRGVEETVAKAN